MEGRELKPCSGYGKPPWRFSGSAVYQLHLVKSEVARALIPKEFKLVEAFGYTLGGFFLANYDDSPAGVFDELVVIAGIVWNPPTSCAWASKVLVNSNSACLHGRKDVGLPSHVARFTKCCPEQRIESQQIHCKEHRPTSFLNLIGFGSATSGSGHQLDTEVTEISEASIATENIFSIGLLNGEHAEKSKACLGPLIKMSLPSFSGRTEYNPSLMKYSCQMEGRVRVMQPLHISRLLPSGGCSMEKSALNRNSGSSDGYTKVTKLQGMEEATEQRSRLSLSVMLSKPILALKFSCLNMNVEAPLIISQ